MLNQKGIVCQQNFEKSSRISIERHDTMKLIPLFLRDLSLKSHSLQLKPSVYLREMLLSTDERLEQLVKPLQKQQDNPLFLIEDHKDFRITPPVVIFQSFTPGKQYNATFTVRNTSEGSKFLSLDIKPNKLFSVTYLSKVCTRLAPGISLHFLVKFSPQSDQDSGYIVSLATDNQPVRVPILGLGPRPMVNFPDCVDLKETLVKVPCNKSFYVKNIGQVPAAFSIMCEKPFSVMPEKIILDVGKIAMITIQFEADVVNDYFRHMTVRFETGEEMFVELTSSSKNGKIWLDTSEVHFEDTYMGLTNQKKVTLYNDSEVTIKFSWLKFRTVEEDFNELKKLKEGFKFVKVNETLRCNKLEYNDVINENDHGRVYSRICTDETQLLSTKDLLFSNTNFEIFPVEGVLWPGGRGEMTVVFKPQTAEYLCTEVFCDVAGRDSRLPLCLGGHGIGPLLELCFRSLDIGAVFLGAIQCYEIVVANKGDIPGSIEHIPTKMVFGGNLTCKPETLCVLPFEMKSFIISFSSGRTGKFMEDVKFRISQSGEEQKVLLKGRIVNPTVSFDVTNLDFGCVAVGFPKTTGVCLVNQSEVPVEFSLRVPSDGFYDPVTCWDFAQAKIKPAIVPFCQEFTLNPENGVVHAKSTLPIEVTLVTNTTHCHTCTLVAENKSGKLSEPISLPVVYESQVATLECRPSEVEFRFCFISYEYMEKMTLINVSNLPAYFIILPQQESSLNPFKYTVTISEYFLQPGQSMSFTATVVPLIVGKFNQDVMMIVFGKSEPITLFTITCSTQGPNVSTNVEALNFGKLILLESKTLSLDLTNDSPIGANFEIYAEGKHQAKWSVMPRTGHLHAGETKTISVTVTVLDPSTVSASLLVHVEHSRVINIGLFASASGCGILTEPKIFPEIDLGYLFSRRLYQFTIKLHNPGTRHHMIHFIPERLSIRSVSVPTISLFKFVPYKFDLEGGHSTEIILEGQSNKEFEVSESFVCWAIINKRGIKQNLGSIQIKANFIMPMIELSERSLEFEINIGPNSSQGQTDMRTLALKNISNLPVTVILELAHPFLISESETSRSTENILSLNPYTETEVAVVFWPPLQCNLQSTTYHSALQISYKEHPQKDKINLKGKLNFPNLQFSHTSVDFGCIPLDFQDHREILMVNPTPIPVTYSFTWDLDSVAVTYFEKENIEEVTGVELTENLKLDPLCENRLLPMMKYKELITRSLPLVFVEPVPVNPAMFDKGHEDETGEFPIEKDKEDEIHKILFPLIQCYYRPEHPTPEFNILPKEMSPVPVVSEIFNLTPTEGVLEPFQSQVLNVAFRPPPFTGIVATAVCSVLGGPMETIQLSGQSSRHMFSLSSTYINFGFRAFTEICEEMIELSNMSQLPFTFRVSSAADAAVPPNIGDVELGRLTIEPSYGKVDTQTSISIYVRFYPGLTGEFQQQFTIQVGYLEPVIVLVTGYGVLPQVSVNQAHISRPRLPIYLGYKAVASLTARRFQHTISCHHLSVDLTEPPSDDFLSDWVLINFADKFPTNIDIWLALERLIASTYFKENPQFLSLGRSRNNTKHTPQLVFPGYVVDLGSVVVGTTTEATVMVENRGLIRADVTLGFSVPEKKLKQDGFFINFQNHISLPIGRSVPMIITIKPSPGRYSDKQEIVHFTVYMEVNNGGVIPIYIKALLTVPYVTLGQKTLDFGDVHCGQCCIKCIVLKNCGAVEVEWNATLVGVKRRRRYKDSEEEMPFFIKRTSALFPPKTAELIEIGFIPSKERLYETMLKLEVKHNPEKMTVQLIGSGVEPRLFLDPLTVQFGAHVPYSGVVQRELIVSNKCPFNIELYFPDFDSAILEEDRVLRVLTHLYNSDKLLLPLDLYDTALSKELKDFYKKLVDNAREMAKLSMEAAEDIVENSSIKIPSISQKTLSKNESNTSRDEKTSNSNNDGFVPPSHRLSLMSLAGIENYLHGLIDDSSKLGGSSDPLELRERTVPLPASDTRDPNKGILLVFHGAPKTDYIYWANRTANKLLLSVKTLDQMILEEAAGSDRLAAVKIQQAVYDSYMELAVDLDAVETLTEVGAGVNYDELCKRVSFLSTAKPPPILVDEKKKGAGGKKSPKPKTADKTDSPATFGDIPVEVFIDLIKDRLLEEVEIGLVIVTLTGFFLKSVKSAVSVILKCVGHISCLDFVTLFNTHTHHLLWKTKCQQRKDVIQKMVEEEKMVLFDKMSRGQLMELSAEDQLMFENTVLEDRQQLLNKLRARKRQTSLPTSPATTLTIKSKKDDKKSKKQSVGGSEKTKGTKTTVKGKNKNDLQNSTKTPSPTNLKSKQPSVKSSKLLKELKVMKEAEDDAVLEAQFVSYQQELEELVTLLGRWNKTTKEFEGLDRLPSLFSVPKPQTKKGTKPSAKPHISNNTRNSGTDVGVNCNIIKFPLNPKDAWFDELIKFKANRETFIGSKKIEKEWFEISLPYPLTLASVQRPEIRTQNTDLGYFKILDGKFTGLEIEVFDHDVTDQAEQVVDVQHPPQEQEEKLDEIISEKTADSVASSSESERGTTVMEGVIEASQDSASTTGSKKSETSVSTLSTDDTVEEKFTARVNLEPGEKRSWKVFFDPKKLAVYHQTLRLEVGGWRKKYNVFLSATCDIPHIDNNPTAIFKKVHTTLSLSSISNNVYLLDENQFYFGPVYATEANKDRTNDVATKFCFTNISAVDVEISFEFLNEDNIFGDFPFGFTSKSQQIPPGKSKFLEVYACPQVIGKFEGTIVYSILNNPEPGFIQMTCIGVLCDFELTPKVVKFERVLLYRKECSLLNLANRSYKPLGWRLVGVPLLSEQLSVSQQSGVIQALQTANVYLNFHAQWVEVATQSIQIEVYDDEFRGEPFVTESLEIVLESVDVLVDIIFPSGKYSEINFDTVQVGEPETQTIILKNKGKYDVTFQIKFNDEADIAFDAEKMFTFTPKSGILPKLEKQVQVKICCLCPHPVHISSVPVFKVWLVDTAPQTQPVAAVPINVTIDAFTSQYKVIPESELNFGPILVGTKKIETIIVKNTGKFEFVFSVKTLEQVEMESLEPSQGIQDQNKSVKSSKGKSTKTQESTKEKSVKGKASSKKTEEFSSLTAGVFSISHTGGRVAPGSSFTLSIECNVETEEDYSQVIVIKLLDHPWNKKKGTHITLTAAAFLPSVNFENLDYIFQEALPVSTENFVKTGEPHIVFHQEQKILWFNDVCVGSEASLSMHLHLRNLGLVNCEVTVTSAHLTPQSAFIFEPRKFSIMSQSEFSFRVAFVPTQIGTFTEELQVSVMVPEQSTPQMLTTTLIGKAHLPQVQVIKPPRPSTCEIAPPSILEFPPTLVGYSVSEQVVFVNSGSINCTVIIEVFGNKHKAFSFQMSDRGVLQCKDTDFVQEMRLAHGQVCEVGVMFLPMTEGQADCELKLYVTNNPYEDQKVTIRGTGYLQDVVLDGMPLVAEQKLSLVDDRPALRPLKYKLKIGPCHVRDTVRHLLVLKNQTSDHWYRFQWSEELPLLSVSPTLGHLPPETSKEVVVTFQSLEPGVVLKKKELNCLLAQIQLKEESNAPFGGWDNNLKTVKWMESLETPELGARRVLCFQEEPEFEELPVTNISLALLVSASADYAKVVCSTRAITFPTTIVQQTEEHTLVLSNKGLVPAIFSWTQQNQSRSCLDDSRKASYGAVSMSSERPRLQPITVDRRPKEIKRPATCSCVKPCPIPNSVELVSRDDSVLELPRSRQSVSRFCWPIIVEPRIGKIQVGEQTTCVVRFQPKELSSFSCELQLSVENEEPGAEMVVVGVEGCSMLPCCHLVVADCLPSSLPDQLQLQFRVLGIGRQIHKCVTVVNTTSEDYTFHWKDLSRTRLSPFACSVPTSKLNATKHMEVLFTFIPQKTGTYRSMWQLSIPERHVEQSLQLLGIASEPSLCFLPNFLCLRTTLIGVRSEGKVQLVNQEECDLKFTVDPNSLYSETWGQAIQVLPMKGVIPAQSQIDIKLCLTPTQAGEGQFHVRVSVQLLRCPLILDLTAQCYQVQPMLVYNDSNRASHHMRSDKDNCIDIGVMETRIPMMLNFTLTNVGKPVFHYHWLWESDAMVSISAATTTGLVGPQAKLGLSLQLTALGRTAFQRLKVQLFISKGPTFVLLLSGTAAQPVFKFSFCQHDFGPCFVQNSDVDYNKTNLMFSNMDENPLLIEGQFDNKQHLRVGISQTTVVPRSELSIPIVFLPRACQSYKETVGFLINGTYQYTVTVSGRGINFNVMLVNPVDKLISLEGTMVGRAKKRMVTIINHSEVCVCPTLRLEPSVPEVTLAPAEPVRLKPGQEATLAVRFSADTLVKGIEQELCVRFQDNTQVLSAIRVSSVGMKVFLDRQFLPFGSTVLGNTATSRLLLCNSGDFAVRFTWEVKKSVFAISPAEGYSVPGSNVTLTVSYTPETLQADISCQAVCTLSNHGKLSVELSGSCVDVPPPLMTISLSCPVRQIATTDIPIFNKFGQEVSLSASISGEYFSGDKVASLPPYGTQLFKIKYAPMKVITSPQLHKGTALFYLMDGSCLVYVLEGFATPPAMAERLQVQSCTHTPHTLIVPVHNWLQVPQKFLVTHSLESSSEPVPRYKLLYHPYLMVSGSKTRELSLTLTSYLPGTLTFKIMLTNESTEEYQWYEVVCEVQPCGPLADFSLTTTVRQPVYHDLVVRNPLDSKVSVGCVTDVPGLTVVVNTPLSVYPLQQGIMRLQYLPLWPCEISSNRLELTSEQLGVLPYTVKTSALPPPPGPPLHLTCDLGLQTSGHVQLSNHSSLQAIFECTSSHEDVTVENPVTVAPGVSKSMNVLYQPSSLTNISSEIRATSLQAGDFLFTMIGTSLYPEPRGPYTLTPGSNVTVPIKNVFREAKTFIFSVDNLAFIIKEPTLLLEPSQVVEVTVKMAKLEGKQFPQYPETGKLTVSVTDEALCHIQWVFYLCGLLDTSRPSS